MKIVVIGANHAGTAAVNTILDNYKGNEVVVFERNVNASLAFYKRFKIQLQ